METAGKNSDLISQNLINRGAPGLSASTSTPPVRASVAPAYPDRKMVLGEPREQAERSEALARDLAQSLQAKSSYAEGSNSKLLNDGPD